jgi:flagellar assembly protein FliH
MLTKVLEGDQEPSLRRITWRGVEDGRRTRPRQDPPSLTADQKAVSDLQLADWKRQAEEQAKESYAEGVRAGEAAAKAAAAGELKQAVQTLADSVVEISRSRAEILRRAEGDVVRLSIEIARRILHRELTLNTSALEALIRAALEKLQAQEVYRVRIHSGQEELMRSCLEKSGRSASVEVISDPSQPVGGAVFEINSGVLDASVETQLREIELGLTDRLQDRL